jgi:IS6 family transposase
MIHGVAMRLISSEVKGHWTYLYRAVDSTGKTIDFMLSEKRDAKSAELWVTFKHKGCTVDKTPSYFASIEILKNRIIDL